MALRCNLCGEDLKPHCKRDCGWLTCDIRTCDAATYDVVTGTLIHRDGHVETTAD